MTITSYNDLREWFFGNNRKGKPAPYWTLYGQAYGKNDTISARNHSIDEVEQAYTDLEDSIRRQNHPEGQRFRVLQSDVPGGNNPVAQVFVQVSSTGVQNNVAGIGSLPGSGFGYMTEADFSRRMAEEKTRWDLEQKVKQLEDRINAPEEADPVEKTVAVIERLANTAAGAAIISKLTGIPASELMQGIHGTAAPDEEIPADDQTFYDNIQQSAELLGTSPHVLADRMKKLIQKDPETAKLLLRNG